MCLIRFFKKILGSFGKWVILLLTGKFSYLFLYAKKLLKLNMRFNYSYYRIYILFEELFHILYYDLFKMILFVKLLSSISIWPETYIIFLRGEKDCFVTIFNKTFFLDSTLNYRHYTYKFP